MNSPRKIGKTSYQNEEHFFIYCDEFIVKRRRTSVLATYSPDTGQCANLAYLRRTFNPTFVCAGNKEAMIVDSDSEDLPISELFAFKERQVRSLPPLNFARACHGACAVGEIFVICGGLSGNKATNTCEAFSRYENCWVVLPELKQARYGVSVVALPNSKVLAIGGAKGMGGDLSSVEIYELPLNFDSSSSHTAFSKGWESFVPTQQPRFRAAATLYKECVFVAGGYNEMSGELTSVEMIVFAAENAQWILLASTMIKAEDSLSLVASLNGIYAFAHDVTRRNVVQRLQMEQTQKSVNTSSECSFNVEVLSAKWALSVPIPLKKNIKGVAIIPNCLHRFFDIR